MNRIKVSTNYAFGILKKIYHHLSKSRVEPQIVQKHDCNGNIYWQVYDPISATHCSLSSEQEVRAWLDSRYYLSS